MNTTILQALNNQVVTVHTVSGEEVVGVLGVGSASDSIFTLTGPKKVVQYSGNYALDDFSYSIDPSIPIFFHVASIVAVAKTRLDIAEIYSSIEPNNENNVEEY